MCMSISTTNFSFIKFLSISPSPLLSLTNTAITITTTTVKEWRQKADDICFLSTSLSHFPGCLCGVVRWVQTSSKFLVSEDSVWTGCTGSSWDHTGSPFHPEIKLVWSSPVSSLRAAVPFTSTRCCCDQTLIVLKWMRKPPTSLQTQSQNSFYTMRSALSRFTGLLLLSDWGRIFKINVPLRRY